MKKINKLISAALSTAMIFTCAVPSFAAQTYSDLTDHWSKASMESLAEKGYLKGYDDGLMRPENKITAAEALTLLSRFYKTDSEVAAEIDADYGTAAAAAAGETLWVKDALAKCLAAGIILPNETSTLNLNQPIKKELLSVYMIRAMKLQNQAESMKDAELAFGDKADITPAYTGYVALLVSNDIIHGDDLGNFSPALTVSRAVVATMVENALNYMDRESIELEFDAYKGLAKTQGVITGVNGSYITVRCFDGLTRGFSIPAAAAVTDNSKTAALTSLMGAIVNIKEVNGAVASVTASTNADAKVIQGKITSLDSKSRYAVTIRDFAADKTTSYTLVSEKPYLEQDGKTVEYAGLKSGSFVTAVLKNGELTQVYAVSGEKEVTGTIGNVTYGTTVTLQLVSEGVSYYYYMDISDLPKIKRGSLTITIDRLSSGEAVNVVESGGLVTLISAKATESSVTGTIESITQSADGTSWTVKTASGSYTYKVESNADAYDANDKAIKTSAISIGDTVKLTVYGDSITSVYLQTATSASEKISGSILDIKSSGKVLTILTADNHLLYVSATGMIVNVTTGKSVSFSSLEVGNKITAYGSYDTASEFTANSIIIE